MKERRIRLKQAPQGLFSSFSNPQIQRDEEEDHSNEKLSINPYLEVESEEDEIPSMVSAEITSIDTPSVEKNIPKVININSEDVFDGGMMIEPVIVNKKEEKEKVERFIDPIIP